MIELPYGYLATQTRMEDIWTDSEASNYFPGANVLTSKRPIYIAKPTLQFSSAKKYVLDEALDVFVVFYLKDETLAVPS